MQEVLPVPLVFQGSKEREVSRSQEVRATLDRREREETQVRQTSRESEMPTE